jgi:predicted nucleotidyltransferase component of viral defense system
MKPLRRRLEEYRARSGVPWEVLERDYLLSWILAGISRVPGLRDTLVFKGGTALKKCYFGDYRFSEDLDFSATIEAPRGDAMEGAVRGACAAAAGLLEEYAPVEILCERYLEKYPHPGGQEAFLIRARFPWQRELHARVMIEITMDEQVLRRTTCRAIIHEYGEPLAALVTVYSLEEIVAEKLRAILQHVEALSERGWSRSRARDFYDLWRILGTYQDQMNFEDFAAFLAVKCTVRRVTFVDADDFFQPALLAHVESTWRQWLAPLVPELATYETVMGELRPQIELLLS